MTLTVMVCALCAGDERVQSSIDALRDELRAYSVSQGQARLDDERATDIRAAVKDALSDASRRASFQVATPDDPFPGDNFYRRDAEGTEVTTADGRFRIHLNIEMQIRGVWNHREGLGDTQGFEQRRLKFNIDGHAYSKDWRYRVEIAFPNSGTQDQFPDLEAVWVGRVLAPGLQLKMGQFKPYFNSEELGSSPATFFAERSVLNTYFKENFARGLGLEWETEDFMWRSGFFDGMTVKSPTTAGGADYNISRTADQPWNNSINSSWSAASRFDWKLMGTWKDTRDYTPWLDMKGAVLNLGVAGAGEQTRPVTPDDPWMMSFTGDVLYKQAGWGLYSWGVVRRVQSDEGTSNEWGALVQATTMLTEKLAAGVRYSIGDTDADSSVAYSQVSLIEGNLTYYFQKHLLKLQLDGGYSFNGISSSPNGFGSTGNNLLPDNQPPDDASGQVYVSVQLQVLF